MLPPTSPAPTTTTTTSRLNPTPNNSTAATISTTKSSLSHSQPSPAPTARAPDTAAGGATAGSPFAPTAASEPGAGPPHKRGPSLSYDGQSPDSTSSLPSAKDNASDISQDQRTKKRRTGVPGSRGVANLTPAQLAKKRANDREAQRAIRERTKNQIEGLENRIRELTAQKPYQELQEAIRQKNVAEAKVEQLRAQMASVVAMLQPFLSSDNAESNLASPIPASDSIQATREQQHQQKQKQKLSSYSSHSESTTPSAGVTPQSGAESSRYSQPLQASSQPDIDTHQPKIPNLNIGDERIQLDALLDPSQRLSRMQTGVHGAQDSPAYQHLPMKHDWSVAMHFGRDKDTSANSYGSPPTFTQQNQPMKYAPNSPNPPQTSFSTVHVPIKHTPATCPLDFVLLDFMRERRERAAEGVPTRELVGPEYPSITSLLNPVKGPWSHPVSKVFTDVLSKFSALCRVPEKVAVLYVMFVIMRWHISPTQETYNLIPEFARPLDIQFTLPHPAWIDYLPFPALRELFVRNNALPEFQFDEIFVAYTLTLSLNWPYEETDALIITPDGSETIINPVFMRHLHRIENWTLGDAFIQVCPAAQGTFNLKRDGSSLNQNHAQVTGPSWHDTR